MRNRVDRARLGSGCARRDRSRRGRRREGAARLPRFERLELADRKPNAGAVARLGRSLDRRELRRPAARQHGRRRTPAAESARGRSRRSARRLLPRGSPAVPVPRWEALLSGRRPAAAAPDSAGAVPAEPAALQAQAARRRRAQARPGTALLYRRRRDAAGRRVWQRQLLALRRNLHRREPSPERRAGITWSSTWCPTAWRRSTCATATAR